LNSLPALCGATPPICCDQPNPPLLRKLSPKLPDWCADLTGRPQIDVR
jgi:hypothetical protein